MFDELIIRAMPELVKFFRSLNMSFYFTKDQVKNFKAFVVAMMMKGFSGKMSDVADLTRYSHRTSFGRFLDSPAWDEEWLITAINRHVLQKIWGVARQTKEPIYVIIDDTICEKALPSSKAESPIYGCSFHKSHLKNKTVYGHQFVGCMLRVGDLVLPYKIVLYEKLKEPSKTKSKIAIAQEIVASLPTPPP